MVFLVLKYVYFGPGDTPSSVAYDIYPGFPAPRDFAMFAHLNPVEMVPDKPAQYATGVRV